jgi:hypothetical protein
MIIKLESLHYLQRDRVLLYISGKGPPFFLSSIVPIISPIPFCLFGPGLVRFLLLSSLSSFVISSGERIVHRVMANHTQAYISFFDNGLENITSFESSLGLARLEIELIWNQA